MTAHYPDPDDVEAWTEIASNPRATPADLAHCMDPRRPVGVRLAAVSNPAHPEVTIYAAAGDADPLIRAHALLSPILDEETRTRLMDDTEAMHAASQLTGDVDLCRTGKYVVHRHRHRRSVLV